MTPESIKQEPTHRPDTFETDGTYPETRITTIGRLVSEPVRYEPPSGQSRVTARLVVRIDTEDPAGRSRWDVQIVGFDYIANELYYCMPGEQIAIKGRLRFRRGQARSLEHQIVVDNLVNLTQL